MNNSQLLSMRALVARVPADTSISDRLTAALSRIESDASAIYEIYTNPDPMKSSIAIDLLINQEKSKMRDLIAKTRGELLTAIVTWRTGQEAARMKKADLKPDAYAAETRSVFRQMTFPAQLQWVNDAVARNDGAAVAAITESPAYLSGLTQEQVDRFREMFLDKVEPSSADIADSMLAVVTTFVDTANAFAEPDGAAARQVTQAQAA